MNNYLVIVPTYNEADIIESFLKTVLVLPEHYAVLVVDDGSPDGTAQIVSTLQKKYPQRLFLENRTKKEGLGRAYLHGFKWALF